MNYDSAEPYPAPVRKQKGDLTSVYIYETLPKAFQASLIAEQIAELRWMHGTEFGYTIPGRITDNPDGTFSVVIA